MVRSFVSVLGVVMVVTREGATKVIRIEPPQ